ncbi:hypothetical protein FA15DRAFT_513416 [Coprinopsis marcescibilis]|uniref:FAD-binding PCMH-type domain-containing protein n=1 Tax=Coprinopsis marcescibilis TaxID=230819 RepID=A0A5C3KPW4_COPMA|nr:hypothetical protein FA15DRAFT_513416 [Coprinopsis marcescibilis]
MVPINPSIEPLPKELYDELVSVCRGPVVLNDDADFVNYATIFNGNVETRAKAVACPLDAEDVSRIVLFCTKHGLSPSVKAGGYGTAGWAIGGDLIIDLSKITEVDIERPHLDGSFTSLRDVASANSKGKGAVETRTGAGKRRREDDASLRFYDNASHTVASLLSGAVLADLERINATAGISLDGPSPNVRRRLDIDTVMPVISSRQISQESNDSSNSGLASDSNLSGVSTVATSPSPGLADIPMFTLPTHSLAETNIGKASDAEESPFGYLDDPNDFPVAAPPSAVQASYNPHARLHTWGSGSNTVLNDQQLFGGQLSVPVQAEAIYPHAFVTFGAGMRQKEIDTFTAKNKLEARYITGHGDGIPYHVPFSAHPVGSSIMLLGGFGFLSRLHGLSIDNLVEVEMVLADGRIVVVNEHEYPDLWWAVRGGGTALGIATRYKAKAYPVPVVFAGNLIYRFNKATAPSLIKHFRDCVKGAPRELYANVLLTAGPQGKDSLAVVQLCYVGPREKGQEYLAAISSWTGERCLLNEVDEKSFLHQQDSVAQVLRGKAGRQWFIRSALISALPDDIIHTTVLQFADTPVGCTWLFELAGGAVSDFDDNVVPKAQREALFTIAALHQWEMDANDDRCIETAEEWIADTLKPVHVGGAFPSFLGRHETPDRIKASFGVNWERLIEIKKIYDPRNLLQNSYWPLNKEGETVDPRTHEPPTPAYLDSWERAAI